MRPLRRENQALSEERTLEIFNTGSYGVLALNGDDGYTYSVPVNYALVGKTFYFHGSQKGHRTESVKRTPKACFCVVAKSNVVPELRATDFESAMAFGKLRAIEDKEEKLKGLWAITNKFSFGVLDNEEAIKKGFDKVFVYALECEYMTGKCASARIKERDVEDESVSDID